MACGPGLPVAPIPAAPSAAVPAPSAPGPPVDCTLPRVAPAPPLSPSASFSGAPALVSVASPGDVRPLPQGPALKGSCKRPPYPPSPLRTPQTPPRPVLGNVPHPPWTSDLVGAPSPCGCSTGGGARAWSPNKHFLFLISLPEMKLGRRRHTGSALQKRLATHLWSARCGGAPSPLSFQILVSEPPASASPAPLTGLCGC